MFLRLLYLIAGPRKYSKKSIRINGRRISVYIADTFMKKMFGLMYFALKENEGMLFPFGWESRQGTAITMMNMKRSIDIVWLNKEGIVVDVVEHAKPCSSIFSDCNYVPAEKAKYVLEFEAGRAKKLKLRKGGKIHL